jgi:CBS-domain-containing membrane protein
MTRMIVREVMTRPALTVRSSTPIKAALALLDQHSITALPVVNGHGRIRGVVSEADLIRDAVPPDVRVHVSYGVPEMHVLPPHDVGEVMTRHPVTVHPESDLAEAIDLLTSIGIKSLPVVDDHDVVVGVISRRDVVRILARPDNLIQAETDDLFRRLGLEWTVHVENGVAKVSGPGVDRGNSVASVVAAAVPGVVGVYVDD